MTEEELARRTRVSTPAGATVVGEISGKRLWDALRCAPKDGVDVEFPRLKWKPRKVEF
jgi:translation initiation factor IF-1